MSSFLEMREIEVRFGAVSILQHASFEIRRNEIHALMGENGAGKSSLMKVLMGLYPRKSGDIYIDGQKVTISSPQEAIRHGIVMIHQELQLASDLTVAENVFLGREPKTPLGTVNRKEMNEQTRIVLNLLKATIRPDEKVKHLGIAQQQMVAIAKALSSGAKVIIMDESTTALTESEVSNLFAVLRDLRDQGVTFLMITHRLEEVFEMADRITVMRDGTTIATVDVAGLTTERLIALMVGREVNVMFPKTTSQPDGVGLEVRDLTLPGILQNINFKAYRGEVLGIAGLMGAGRTELFDVLFGVRRPTSGTLLIDEKTVSIHSPADAIRNKIAYVTEDRKGNGLALQLPVNENIVLPIVNQLSKFGVIKRKEVVRTGDHYIDQLQIKIKEKSLPVQVLSGGNQQKVILAKWLSSEPEIFLLDEPTRGIDVKTKVEVYNLINELTKKSKTVLLVSSYLPELMAMSDRFIVLCEGSLTKELSKEEATAENIVYYASTKTV